MIDQNITDAIVLWHREHGNVPCTKANGLQLLIAIYLRYTTNKTVVQARSCIKDQLRKVRPIINPEYTPQAYLKKEVGEHTSVHKTNKKVLKIKQLCFSSVCLLLYFLL